ADTIGDMHILPSVVVKVGEQYTPAPVGSIYSSQLSYLAEKWNACISRSIIASVQLEHIAHKFRFIPAFPFLFVTVIVQKGKRNFLPIISFGEHIECDDIGQCIII